MDKELHETIDELSKERDVLAAKLEKAEYDNGILTGERDVMTEYRDALLKERDALRGNSLVCWLRKTPEIDTIRKLFEYFKMPMTHIMDDPDCTVVTFSNRLLAIAATAIKDDSK